MAPGSAREQQVAAIWQEVLKLERVGLVDNFELGGHSLLVTQVVSRVRRALDIEVPLRSLFEHSTLQDFVQALDAGHGEQPLALVPVPRDKPLPLSFAQERQWFLWKMDLDSAAYNIPTALRLRGALDTGALRQSFCSAAGVSRKFAHHLRRRRWPDLSGDACPGAWSTSSSSVWRWMTRPVSRHLSSSRRNARSIC